MVHDSWVQLWFNLNTVIGCACENTYFTFSSVSSTLMKLSLRVLYVNTYSLLSTVVVPLATGAVLLNADIAIDHELQSI